jgi:hypothetical protein
MNNPNPVMLLDGDKLKDLYNEYEVIGSKYTNSHSQYPSHYLLKAVSGYHEGKECWVENRNLQDCLPDGKYWKGIFK